MITICSYSDVKETSICVIDTSDDKNLAVAACLHCNAVGRLFATPHRFIITFPPRQKNNDEGKTKTELAQNHVYKGSKNNIL